MILLRTIYLVIGFISLALGFLGIFLPLLPTTPFVLLAAYCFSKGSPKIHAWLINHPLFGNMIRDWNERGVIHPKIKWLVTLLLPPPLLYSILFKEIPTFLKVLIFIIGASVLLFIWTRPSDTKTLCAKNTGS